MSSGFKLQKTLQNIYKVSNGIKNNIIHMWLIEKKSEKQNAVNEKHLKMENGDFCFTIKEKLPQTRE